MVRSHEGEDLKGADMAGANVAGAISQQARAASVRRTDGMSGMEFYVCRDHRSVQHAFGRCCNFDGVGNSSPTANSSLEKDHL